MIPDLGLPDPERADPELERWYRRLVACYPRSFRRQNAEEIVAVLLATAAESQRRPSLAETADLLRGAARAHLGLSGSPRTILIGVRLMYMVAVTHLGVLIAILLSADSVRTGVRAAALRQDPAISAQLLAKMMTTVNVDVAIDIALTPIAIIAWVLLAWANGHGRPMARVAAIIVSAFNTAAVGLGLMEHSANYAPVAMIAAGVSWALGVAAVASLLRKQSWAYYERQAAVR
jgi:hypothetical protein